MNIHEFQAKQLLAQYGVTVPSGGPVRTPQEAKAQAEKLFAAGHSRVVVKSQIHAGGRGKGTFKSGLQGGVKVCASADEVFERAQAMLGQTLVTKQTGPVGRVVSKLLVEAGAKIVKEFYCAVLLDRVASRPLMMVSTEGGMDIEEVAAKTPEKIVKELIDPATGMMPFQARKLAAALGLRGDLINGAARLLLGVYKTWWESDASLVEINPLCIVEVGSAGVSPVEPGVALGSRPTHSSQSNAASGEAPDAAREARALPRQSLMALDGKIGLDDNGLYRHKDILAMRDLAEESPLEVEASEFSLNYIKLDGSIACLVNGAGLAMATMDIIKHYGGEPANFLDVGGGASVEQVTAAFKIIMKDPNVEAILVNIFGGIMDCDVIAQGIVAAVKETGLKLPLVVRLEGNNVVAGKQTLANSGLPIISGSTMADAAQKVVGAATTREN